MKNIFIGIIIGITLSTVGASGLVRIFDKGVETVREQAKEISR